MKKEFSLVMATYGRDIEIGNFFVSLLKCDYDMSKVEVILVDQNTEIDLYKYVNLYKSKVSIKYIKSEQKGLSKNRNIGLKNVTGEIVAFPDDDCEYLEDTLKVTNDKFNEGKYDLVLGRIVQHDGSDSLRSWDKEKSNVSTKNFYKKCSSITVFLKKESARIKLNEQLGVGEYFGACEDADLIYKNCKAGLMIGYIPEIKIYHPHYNSDNNMSNEKIYSYGLGFGGMVRENLDKDMIILFIKAQGYHFLKMLMYICRIDFKKAKNSLIALVSRFQGLIKYKSIL
ncbi:MAG: glycosyltransferase family 2 protein [Sarcina sp.]